MRRTDVLPRLILKLGYCSVRLTLLRQHNRKRMYRTSHGYGEIRRRDDLLNGAGNVRIDRRLRRDGVHAKQHGPQNRAVQRYG